MPDDEYIQHTAVGTLDDARQSIEPDVEDIDLTPLLDKMEKEADVELDEDDRKTIEEMVKEEIDGTDVVEKWKDWTSPLQPDDADFSKDVASHSTEFIKATGIANSVVDPEREDLKEISEVRRKFLEAEGAELEKKNSEESEHEDPTLDAIWKGTEDARDAVAESEEEDDIPEKTDGPSEFDKTTLIELAAAHGVEEGGTSKTAGEMASDFVKEYFQLSEREIGKLDISEIAYDARRKAMSGYASLQN